LTVQQTPKTDAAWLATIAVAEVTDTGMRRRNNQDSMATVLAETQEKWEQQGHMFIVADGMGAHAAGELASRLASELIPHHYNKLLRLVPAEALVQAIAAANNEIFRRGQANPEFRNMGTTTSVLAILPEGAIVAHVGDSRVYRLRGNQLEQITFDHSLVWEMQATGEVSEDTLKSGVIPKNVITRSLGPNPNVEIDLEGPFALRKGDRFLLCSDGLTGQVSDEELGILLRVLAPDVAARALVDLANLRGGPDNITVIIVEVLGDALETKDLGIKRTVSPVSKKVSRPFPVGLGVAGAVGILAGVVLFALQQWPLAGISAVIGLLSLIIGFVRRGGREFDSDLSGDRYGKGPHRKYTLKPDSAFVDRLAGTIQALRDAAQENQWKVNWDEINKEQERGRAAEKSNDKSLAIQIYATIIVQVMNQARKRREEKSSDSSIEY
jgi:PPM family protein phosphatase